MHYITVWETKWKEFETAVNDKIEEGYVPCGGMCVVREFDNKTTYYQAMTRGQAE